MKRAAQARWVLSFADLCLLLTAFFVLLHAQSVDPRRLAAGLRAGFGGKAPVATPPLDWRARDVFEAGEAILKPGVEPRLHAAAAAAARAHERAFVTGTGSDPGGARLDRWELAAARAAALARALRAGGLAEDRIELALPAGGKANGQTLNVVFAR